MTFVEFKTNNKKEYKKLMNDLHFQRDLIKNEIYNELHKLKPEKGLRNINKFRQNILNELEKDIKPGLLYSLGNAKLPKTTMIINSGTWFNCAGRKENFCDICKECYDKQIEVRFPERFFGRYNQEIFIRGANRFLITNMIINELKKHPEVKLIRWNEVGELRNQHDLIKIATISNFVEIATGVKSYIYTHNKSLNFDIYRPSLIINGSNFMVDNEYRVVCNKELEFEIKTSQLTNCICDCNNCSHCSNKGHKILVEELR